MISTDKLLFWVRSLIRRLLSILKRRKPFPEPEPTPPPESPRPAAIAWRVFGVAVQGSSHERFGIPCQDACEWKSTTDGTLVVAVADGAGSAIHSAVGAQTAVRVVIDYLADSDRLQKVNSETSWDVLAKETLQTVLASIQTEAKSRDSSVKEFATTLLFAVLGPDWIAACQIGDGAIVIRDSSKQLQVLTRPVSGEHVNETVFVTSMSAVSSAQIVFKEFLVSHLCIFTDGLQMLALQMPKAFPHAPFFEALFNFVDSEDASVERLESFLQSSRIRERTDDDITLVLARRCEYEGQSAQ